MFYILISILAGISVVIARIINSNLADDIGIFQGTFVNYATGLITSIIFLFITGETFTYNNGTPIPFWAYLGGLAGIGIVVLSNYVTPRASNFYITLFVFIGQLFFGLLIDYIFFKTLPLSKVLGGLLVLAGLSYNIILDMKKEKAKALNA